MAASIIHLAVANEINKTLKRDNSKILIGSIAPDISKYIGESKLNSHFLDNLENDEPNILKFLDKYRKYLDDDFVMGYFIHLYTDYLWFKYFITEIYIDNVITKLDGSKVKCNGNMNGIYIYNDYNNLNYELPVIYNMDINNIFKSIPKLENIIEEIPMEKIKIIIDKTLVIVNKTKTNKTLVFNTENIEKFISTCVNLTLAKLNELKLF